MKFGLYLFVAVGTATGFAVSPASAVELVNNGSFETPTVVSSQYDVYGVGSTGISGWTVTGAPGSNIAQLKNGVGGIIAADGVQFLDLTGTNDNPALLGGLSQTISTISGQNYALTFSLGQYSSDPGSAGILAYAGSASQNFTLASPASGYVWQSYTLNFTAAGSSTLIGFSGTSGQHYIGLDNVSVLGDAVPEPASWAMMVGGFGLMGGAMRRRRKAVVTFG